MHGVDIRYLQGDVAPAARLTDRIDACGAVFLEKNKAVTQAKGRTARPGLLAEAEDVAIEPAVFAEAADTVASRGQLLRSSVRGNRLVQPPATAPHDG